MNTLETGKSYRLTYIYEIINRDDNCVFLAYMANNLGYVAVNAFIHKLHEEDGIENMSGVVINLRKDLNEGHSFAMDSFRFPEYANIKVVYLDNSTSVGKEGSDRLIQMMKNRMGNNKQKIYMISTGPNLFAFASAVAALNKKTVNHILISEGAVYTTRLKWIMDYLKEIGLIAMERVMVGSVRPFRPFKSSPGMKRCKKIEKYYREATEGEHLIISEMDYNNKYVLYISQSYVYKKYNELVENVLESENRKGYKIYIKPHTHERTPCYPTGANYHVLPRDYAIESIVGSAPRRPDKIIGFSSASMFTCSAWFGVTCYSILNLVPSKNISQYDKVFLKLINTGEYPNLRLYGLDNEKE